MTFPLSGSRTEQYLERLGFDQPPPVDGEGLRALHLAHLLTFPVENLDIHLGRTIVLDGAAIVTKLLDQGRGGYCYELNSAFGSLLASLGFDVDLLEARVYGGEGGDELGIRFDHACLIVRLGGDTGTDDNTGADIGDHGDRLADVGFGSCFLEPILLTPGVDQADPTGTYRLDGRHDGWLDLLRNDGPQYRLSPEPRTLEDFTEGNRYQQTSPSSPFTANTVCSLATERGRVTLRGLQLIETVDGERTERELGPDEVGPVLAARFGVVLAAEDTARLAASA